MKISREEAENMITLGGPHKQHERLVSHAISHAKMQAITPEHLAALRAAIGLWNYGAGDYHGTPLATVPGKLRELLNILEGES